MNRWIMQNVVVCTLILGGLVGCGSSSTSTDSAAAGASTESSTSKAVTEVWSGNMTGQCVGAFDCISGTDGYYDERSDLTLSVPSPGLKSLVNGTTLTSFTGTFSNVEDGIEANGFGCSPAPTISSDELAETAVTMTSGYATPTIELSSSATSLMTSTFIYTLHTVSLKSRLISLSVNTSSDTEMTGTWKAFEGDNTTNVFPGGCAGDFTLSKLSGTLAAIPVRVVLTADKLLGFMNGGDTAQLTAKTYDINGKEITCDNLLYKFENPVNYTINVISSLNASTGLLTIGKAQGASRVWAECDGVVSNLKLVSATGN